MSSSESQRLSTEARAIVERFEPAGHIDADVLGVATMRRTIREAAEAAPDVDLPSVASIENYEAHVGSRVVPVRCYRPVGGVLPVVLFLHGGGFVFGDLDGADEFCRRLAVSTGAVVCSVAYRLAPEHPLPAAIDDGEVALEWLVENGSRLGIDVDRTAVVGSSAGGAIAALVAHRASKRGRSLVCQVLLCPMTDVDDSWPSRSEFAHGALLTARDVDFFWSCALGDQPNGSDACEGGPVVPMRIRDLSALPPTTLVVAECDPLRDEGEAYARRLAEAGVTTRVIRGKGCFHGFHGFTTELPEADRALSGVSDSLRQAFGCEAS